MSKGSISTETLSLKATPSDIQKNPVIGALNLQPIQTCLISSDGNFIQLNHPKAKLRIIKKYARYTIQREFINEQGEATWYQLCPTSAQQAKFWNLSHEDIINPTLPEVILEREAFYWLKNDGTEAVITNKEDEVVYQGKKGWWLWWQYTVAKSQALLSQSRLATHLCSAFEAPSYIKVHKTADGETILLPRYGLKFSRKFADNKLTWHHNDKEFRQSDSLFAEGVASLTFTNADKTFCILPVQAFLRGDRRSKQDQFYQLYSDTENKVNQKILKDLKIKKDTILWQHSHSQKALIVPVIDGKVIPQNAAQAMYLCYVYMASHETDKAWDVLNTCEFELGGLAGTAEEVEYIRRIIVWLPFDEEKSDNTDQHQSPELAACKLRALSLLAEANKHQTIKLPKPIDSPVSVEAHCDIHRAKLLSNFNKQLPSIIRAHYQSYQTLKRELPAPFCLSEHNRSNLLTYSHQALSVQPVGSLGFEWERINLHTLAKERDILNQKSNRSLYEERRLEDINHFFNRHPGVLAVTNTIEESKVDIQLPVFSSKLNTLLRNHPELTMLSFSATTQAVSTSKLHTALNLLRPPHKNKELAIMKAMPILVDIALNKSSPFHSTLTEYCRSALITNLDEDQEEHIELLMIHILYRLLSNLDKAKNDIDTTNQGIKALLGMADALPSQPLIVHKIQSKTGQTKLISASGILSQHGALQHQAVQIADNVKLNENNMPIEFQSLARWRELSEQLKTGVDPNNPDADAKAGPVKFAALSSLKNLAKTTFSDATKRTNFYHQSEARLQGLQSSQTDLLDNLLRLAKKGPSDPHQNLLWTVDIDAGIRPKMTIEKLLTLYFQNDVSLYQLETGLAETEINQLHGLLGQYIHTHFSVQQLQRTLKQLDTLNAATDIDDDMLYQLAQTVFAENLVDVYEEPVQAVFQYYEGILLRPRQKEAIARMIETNDDNAFHNVIEKVIMGGGKSKVLLPMLAKKKARGDNLVAIEVPKALLKTNYIDLRATSHTLFGQEPYLFAFDRKTPCDATILKQYFTDLSRVMVNHNYMVTTGDAIQSLELKYLELLNDKPKDKLALNEWREQVMWLDKLVGLFRNQCDLIIDEVHLGLEIKTKLNYTLGDSSPIPQPIIDSTLALYQFMASTPLSEESDKTFLDLIKNTKLLTNPEQFENACQHLASVLVHSPESPLATYCENLTSDERNQLGQYLQDKGEEIPAFITSSTDNDKDTVALFKQEISQLLAYTLQKRHGESYGPSHNTAQPEVKRVLAIPYKANNIPNEGSRFGHYLESVNFSIQSLLINGLSTQLIKDYIEQVVIEAQREALLKNISDINQTKVAETFRNLTGLSTESLSSLEINDANTIARLHKIISKKQSLVFHILQHMILPNVQTDKYILHSNALNHVNITRSCQGVTGTPSNHTTYHQKLTYDPATAQGTDEYIIEGIKKRTPAIYGHDFQSLSQFIPLIFSHSQPDEAWRALIDINATFCGVSNEAVAEQLARFIHQSPEIFSHPGPLQYVIYFNENNQLSALRIAPPFNTSESILLGSSDPKAIQDRLGVGPEACFTYYDQAHTVGTDIKQAPTAKAMVMTDDKTTISSFLQGAMRMRGLVEGGQSMDIVVPSYLQEDKLDTLITKMQHYEDQHILKQNFEATVLRMENLVRNDLLERILKAKTNPAETAEFKAMLFKEVKAFFIEEHNINLFAQFGRLNQTVPTETLLINFKARLYQQWELYVEKIDKQISEEDKKTMEACLESIIAEANKPGICAKEQRSPLKDTHQSVEVQVEVELEMHQQKEEKVYNQYKYKMEQPYKQCTEQDGKTYPATGLKILPLSKVCTTTNPYSKKIESILRFDDNLLASENFYINFIGQDGSYEQYANSTLKTAYVVLFQKTDSGLKTTLITQQESIELTKWVRKQPPGSAWLSSTRHHTFVGEAPEDIMLDPQYQRLMEQAQFFNGEFDLIMENPYPTSWLHENAEEKFKYFNEHIAPSRDVQLDQQQLLESALTTLFPAFQYIEAHADEDLSSMDWGTIIPNCTQAQEEKLFRTAKAYHYAATHWWDEDISAVDIRSETGMPIEASGLLHQFIQQRQAANWQTPLHQDKALYQLMKLYNCAIHFDESAIEDIKKAYAVTSEAEANRLLDKPALSDGVIIALLGHPKLTLTDNLIKRFLELPANQYRVLAMARNPAFSNHDKSLLDKAQRLSTETALIMLWLKEQPVTPDRINILVENARWQEETITALTKQPLTQAQFATLCQRLVDRPTLLAILLKHPCAKKAAPKLYTAVLSSQSADKVVTAIVKTGQVDKTVFNLITQQAKSAEALAALCESDHSYRPDEKSMLVLLKNHHLNFQPTAKEPSFNVLLSLLEETTSKSVFDIIFFSLHDVSDPRLVDIVLQSPLVNACHLQCLARQITNNNTRKQIFKHPSATNEVKNTKVTAIPEGLPKNTLMGLDAVAAFGPDKALLALISMEKTSQSEPLLLSIAKNQHASIQTLKALLELKDTSTKVKTLAKHHIARNHYNALVERLKKQCDEITEYDEKVIAETLIKQLTSHGEAYFSGPPTAKKLQTLCQGCMKAINQAKPVLEIHRGWHKTPTTIKALLGILAACTILPALVTHFAAKDGYTGTFFKTPKTNPEQSAENIDNYIRNLDSK